MLLEMSQAHANALYIWLGSKWTGVLNIPVTYSQCILLLGKGYHFWTTDVCLTLFWPTPILHSEDLAKMNCGLRRDDRESPTFTDRRCSKFIVLNSLHLMSGYGDQSTCCSTLEEGKFRAFHNWVPTNMTDFTSTREKYNKLLEIVCYD